MLLLLVGLAFVPPAEARPADRSPSPHPKLAESDSLRQAGRYAEAERLLRDLLQRVSQAEGARSLTAAQVLDDLVAVLHRQQRVTDEECIEFASRSLEIRWSLLGPDHPDVADSHVSLGLVHEARGEFADARAHYEDALRIRDDALPPEDPRIAEALVLLANLRARLGEYEGLRQVYERALSIQERSFGEDHAKVAATLINLAILYKLEGAFTKAREIYGRAISIQKQALGPYHPSIARTYHNFANLLVYQGDYPAARDAYLQAIEIREQAYGADHLEIARPLEGLALVLLGVGRLLEAREAAERALEICERSLDPSHPDVGQAVLTLVMVLNRLGDLERAEALTRRGMEIWEAAYGLDHRKIAEARVILGNIRWRAGQHDLAEVDYRRAIAIRETVLGPDHLDLARSLRTLAARLIERGDEAGAGPLTDRALEIYERSAGMDHPELGLTLAVRGEICRLQGNDQEARENLERALRLMERSFGSDHPAIPAARISLALLLYRTGEIDRAFRLALEVERSTREHLRLVTRGLPERQALGFASTRPTGLSLALSIAVAGRTSDNAIREVLDELVRTRTIVLDEIAARHQALGESDDPAVREAWIRRAELSRELAWMIVSHGIQEESEGYRERFELVRDRKEEVERILAGQSERYFAEQRRTEVALAQTLEELPPRSALVSYILYNHAERKGPEPSAGPAHRLGIPTYAAIVIPPDRDGTIIRSLGRADEIDLRVSGWRNEVGLGLQVSGRSRGEAEAACREAGARLRERIWDPIRVDLAGAEHIFIVPDGSLHLINFAALPVDPDRFLVDEDAILHFLSAERDLALSYGKAQSGAGLLAMGNPDFDADTRSSGETIDLPEAIGGVPDSETVTLRTRSIDCPEFLSVAFRSLPNTAEEIEEVATLWEQAGGGRLDDAGRSAAAANDPDSRVVRLTGSGATEGAMKTRSGGFRALHIATHGFFLDEVCASVRGAVRGVGGMRPAVPASEPSFTAANPLLLSGLVLAGANVRAAVVEGEEDGLLTAEEVAAIDLTSVEWAVLSACETGLGRYQVGEGVLGLRRAFRLAGVETVVMSLWAVEDRSAGEWMAELYSAHLRDGLGTALAIRQANRNTLARLRSNGASTHPYGWAAFIATGGRN